jgi:hypothetical protein
MFRRGQCPSFLSCIPHGRVFRNVNRESAGIPVFPSGIGIRYGCQVSGTWHPVPDTRYRIWIDAEGRIPSIEERAQRAHRVCILYPASISY